MQTATATVAGRRRVSFTLPEPAATTFIPRDVESEARRRERAGVGVLAAVAAVH